MEIIQKPISPEHKSAMFFDGVIARKDGLEVRTYQTGEILFMGMLLVGLEIVKLGQTGIIDDEVIEEERTVDIHVDKFFVIAEQDGNVLDEDYIFDNYDDAIEVLKQL